MSAPRKPIPRSVRRRLHPRLLAAIELAESEGWLVGLSPGRRPHLAAWTPEGRRAWTGSSSPSDWRTGLNEASHLRRAIREETSD